MARAVLPAPRPHFEPWWPTPCRGGAALGQAGGAAREEGRGERSGARGESRAHAAERQPGEEVQAADARLQPQLPPREITQSAPCAAPASKGDRLTGRSDTRGALPHRAHEASYEDADRVRIRIW